MQGTSVQLSFCYKGLIEVCCVDSHSGTYDISLSLSLPFSFLLISCCKGDYYFLADLIIIMSHVPLFHGNFVDLLLFV